MNHLGHEGCPDCPVDSRGEYVEPTSMELPGVTVRPSGNFLHGVGAGLAMGISNLISLGNNIALNTANNLMLVSTTIIMPVVNQSHIIYREGIHEGDAYNSDNRVNWAVPYSMKKWGQFIPHPELMGNGISYQDGKPLVDATIDVFAQSISINAPLKVGNQFLQKVLNFGTGLAVKAPLKAGGKKGIEKLNR